MQSIIIADSHNLCREALCDYIRHADAGYTIEGFASYEALMDHMKEAKPNLVLIASDLAGMEEGDVFALKGIKIGVIVPLSYTESPQEPHVKGVFPKSLSCKAFMSGINDILEGRTFFPAIRHDEVLDESRTFKRSPQEFSLTTREKEVLGHLVKGESNKDIARALDLQVVTIKLHVRGICRKMKAANRTQAALIAQENGGG